MEPWRGSRGLPLGFVVPPVVVEQPPPLIDETALGEALHVCAWEGNADEARLLLERGAPVDWRNPDSFNYTPLITAAKYGSTEVVRLLLAHRASVNLTNDYRANPLHQAALYGHEVRQCAAQCMRACVYAYARLLWRPEMYREMARAARVELDRAAGCYWHSLVQSLSSSLSQPSIHSFMHSCIHSLTHSFIHERRLPSVCCSNTVVT